MTQNNADKETSKPKNRSTIKRLLTTLFLTFVAILPSFAFAALTSVTTFVCGVGESLSGPLGLAIGFVVLAGGGIALAVGGRRSLGYIVWATIGIIVTLSAGALVTSLFGEAACGG
ncbi:MAG: TrbC/VirB2 family protein [Trueperaceae bacterium]|nr:TrbC/VirB2 family protein [Trueperaceae bacterium]